MRQARALYFQEMGDDTDPGNVPIIAPELTYSHTSAPTDIGTFWTFDATALSLTRSEGTDTNRLAAEGSWNYIHYGSLGDVTELTAVLRGDLYFIDEAEDSSLYTVDSGTAYRVIPTVGATWRYPFTRDNGWFREVVEPIASFYVSPRGQNKDDIPNEDSRDFEFDATNLFSANRFTGWDRVENGPRATTGSNGQAIGPAAIWCRCWPVKAGICTMTVSLARGRGLTTSFPITLPARPCGFRPISTARPVCAWTVSTWSRSSLK